AESGELVQLVRQLGEEEAVLRRERVDRRMRGNAADRREARDGKVLAVVAGQVGVEAAQDPSEAFLGAREPERLSEHRGRVAVRNRGVSAAGGVVERRVQ